MFSIYMISLLTKLLPRLVTGKHFVFVINDTGKYFVSIVGQSQLSNDHLNFTLVECLMTLMP